MAVAYVNYNGQVANSEGDIVAAVGADSLIISMVFNNISASPATLQVLFKSGASTPRTVLNQTVAVDATVTWDAKMTLVTGDAIRAVSDTNNVIDFWISAAEVT